MYRTALAGGTVAREDTVADRSAAIIVRLVPHTPTVTGSGIAAENAVFYRRKRNAVVVGHCPPVLLPEFLVNIEFFTVGPARSIFAIAPPPWPALLPAKIQLVTFGLDEAP